MGDRLRAGKLHRYVTSHPGQLSLAILPWVLGRHDEYQLRLERYTVVVGLSSHWPYVTDNSGLSSYGFNGLYQGDEHPAYAPPGVWPSFTFFVIA